jgi:hypothetical protein
MKRLICMVIGMCFCLAPVASADDITNLTGRVYTNAVVKRVEPDCLVISFTSGLVKVFFTELSTNIQQKYQYDPQKATAYQADVAKAQTEAAKLKRRAAAEKEINEDLEASVFRAHLTVIQLIDNKSALCKGFLQSEKTNEYEVAVTKQVPFGLAGPGMVRQTKPVTTKEKRTSVDFENVDNVCVAGIPDNMVDGGTFNARLYVAGRYKYTTVAGAAATVYRFATSRALAVELLRQENEQDRPTEK